MLYSIVSIVLLVTVVAWIVYTQHSLAILEENSENAMRQIGLQLSSRFDALSHLIETVKNSAAPQAQSIADAVRTGRRSITGKSAPGEVSAQEALIAKALSDISALSAQVPALAACADCAAGEAAVAQYEKMLCTSRLIYNDSVTRLNRRLRWFPIGFVGGMLGFRLREYL